MNRALTRRTAAFHETRQRLAAIEDTLAKKTALLEVIRSKGMRAILHISNLPLIPADKDYQLWVIRDQKPVNAGVFHVAVEKAGGDLYRIDNLVEADRKRINAFAVTLEPKGGLPQPSGKMYLLGSI